MAKKSYDTPRNRIWNDFQVACRLGKSINWFKEHRERLEKYGFPKRDDLFDGYDSKKIDLFMDKRSGIVDFVSKSEDVEREMIGVTLGYGKNYAAVC